MCVLHASDFDIVQAYLLGKAEQDQQYPVRYPEGEIRDMHRVNGQETYALVVGNVYGLPDSVPSYPDSVPSYPIQGAVLQFFLRGILPLAQIHAFLTTI